jgi:hypothetical protein
VLAGIAEVLAQDKVAVAVSAASVDLVAQQAVAQVGQAAEADLVGLAVLVVLLEVLAVV